MTYAVARLETGYICATKVLAYDDASGTLTVEFMGATHLCALREVHRVRSTMTEIAMSTGQDEAAERVREALNEFRRNRTSATSADVKPPRNRYATIGVSDSPAPSPAVVAPAVKQASVAAPSLKKLSATRSKPTRDAQRLFNDSVEMFFAPSTQIKVKLPNGKVESCLTDKEFGKAFKLRA